MENKNKRGQNAPNLKNRNWFVKMCINLTEFDEHLKQRRLKRLALQHSA